MNLLQLDGYDFAGVTETDHDYHLRAEVTAHRDFCPKCFKRDLVGFGRREQAVHHLTTLIVTLGASGAIMSSALITVLSTATSAGCLPPSSNAASQ